MVPRSSSGSFPRVHRWFSGLLHEPLLHFLLIGAAVFALYAAVERVEPTRSPAVIAVTPAQLERLTRQFEAVWRRPPTAAEREGLVGDYVREEVYYREALALGLDRDDTVIRRRLRQKMEFLSDAGAEALAPSEEELREHLQAHADRFAVPARITFRQVFLGDDDPGAALASLAAGADPGDVGRGSLLPPTMETAGATSVDGTFGDGFFAAVARLPPGEWQGPVASAFGNHLVRLDEAQPAAMPPFEAVRGDVERDWRQEKAAELREVQYQALLRHYRVVLPTPLADQR